MSEPQQSCKSCKEAYGIEGKCKGTMIYCNVFDKYHPITHLQCRIGTEYINGASHSQHTATDEQSIRQDLSGEWICPFRKGCEEGESWCSWPCDKWFAWHNSNIRQDEREKVLNHIIGHIEDDVESLNEEMVDGYCSHSTRAKCDVLSYVLKELKEELRKQEAPK